MYYDDTPKPGGIKGTWYLSSDEFCKMLCPTPPKLTAEERLFKYKKLVDRTPDKWLKYHFDWSVKEEEYELAAYIKSVAEKRGVVIA